MSDDQSRVAEIAWCAGFFDGEGCSFVTSRNERRNLRIGSSINQKDRRVLDKFQSIIGGKVYGPYARGMYTWRIVGERNVCHLRDTLYPYLGEIKRCQFDATFTKWNNRPNARTKPVLGITDPGY